MARRMAALRGEQPRRTPAPLPLRENARAALSPEGRLEIRMQRLLVNHNPGNRHPHWSARHREKKAWEAALQTALVVSLGMPKVQALLLPGTIYGAKGTHVPIKRRLEITRLVKYRSHFVRDTFDNLPWTTKQLRDALTTLGLIYDDSPEWCETTITQDVSVDGLPWTWIAIEPITAHASAPVGATR